MKVRFPPNGKRVIVLAVLSLLILTVTPVLAWWSGWYDAGFSGSYSPGTGTRYRHGQWDSSAGGGTAGTPYTITLYPNEQFPVHVFHRQGALTMSAALAYSLQSKQDLEAYVQYARTYPLQELRKANVERALTVVTFNRLMSEEEVDALLAAAQDSAVGIKALYVDASDPNPATRTWTVGILDLQGKPYASALQELVADITSNGLHERGSLELHFAGIPAVTAWLPLDAVEFLNSRESVYLADPSPSYLRLVASRTREAEQIRANLEQVELLPDGLPSFIHASFNDVYPYLQLFAGDRLPQEGALTK